MTTHPEGSNADRAAAFIQARTLSEELLFALDLCASCRLCLDLCPSFPALFDAVDEHDGDDATLTEAETRRIVDLCYDCKLCYNRCPYKPPHEYGLDYPRLLVRARLHNMQREGIPLRGKLMGRPDLVGCFATANGATAGLVNMAERLPGGRWGRQLVSGVSRHRAMLPYVGESFSSWVCEHVAEPPSAPDVVLFYTCSVNWNLPQVGRAAVDLLARAGVSVAVPQQRCCGMPLLDNGEIDAALTAARGNIDMLYPYVKQGAVIVALGATCGYMLKREYADLVGSDAARVVADATKDVSEFLEPLLAAGDLQAPEHAGATRVLYHAPCHIQAQQMGRPAQKLLEAVPGFEVTVVDKCAGVDGTWGLKSENYEASQDVAKKLMRQVEAEEGASIVSDCPLAAMQIQQAAGRRVQHPVELLAAAYRP